MRSKTAIPSLDDTLAVIIACLLIFSLAIIVTMRVAVPARAAAYNYYTVHD